MKLILASASPRRAEILRTLRIPFEVRPADIEEIPRRGESPADHAVRLAESKALDVARSWPNEWVLGGDTVVTIDRAILGKPGTREEAVGMLMRLQGRTHYVVSALALARAAQSSHTPVENETSEAMECVSETGVTAVTFRSFDETTARAYANAEHVLDKAGGYAIQDLGSVLVETIEGDYSCVVGLPVPVLARSTAPPA